MLDNLLPEKTALPPARARRLQFWSIVTIFVGLGFYVGVWAVLVADLVKALHLTPALLGFALSCFPSAGILVLLFGGALADRFPRRLILLVGIGGLSLLFIALTFVSHYAVLLLILLCGGACVSCYDLAVNTIGGDYERYYTQKSMTLFHAGFNIGAALGAVGSALALAHGISFRLIYAMVALLFLLLAAVSLLFPLPPTLSHFNEEEKRDMSIGKHFSSVGTLLATRIVLLATLIVCLAFFTDGTLEGYISIYLRNLLGSGALLGGVGIAAFYLIGTAGKVGSTVLLRRYGERLVVTLSALCAAVGMVIVLSTNSTLLAVLGLLLVGLGQAPLVPTGFSLASQVEARQGARAIALVTAFGYSVFLVSPPLIGTLATLFSLRVALLLTIVTSLGIMLIAQRLPGRQRQNSKAGDDDAGNSIYPQQPARRESAAEQADASSQ